MDLQFMQLGQVQVKVESTMEKIDREMQKKNLSIIQESVSLKKPKFTSHPFSRKSTTFISINIQQYHI